MALCEKCGSKTILAIAFVNCFDPDEEPYESGVREKCGYESGITAEVSVGIHWCPKCVDIEDVWIEQPTQKKIHDAKLQAENERYKTAMRKCIKSMEGSNCLELKWLEEALKGE